MKELSGMEIGFDSVDALRGGRSVEIMQGLPEGTRPVFPSQVREVSVTDLTVQGLITHANRGQIISDYSDIG